MLDCIIIGNGTAAVSAALTLQANAKTFIVIGSSPISEKIVKAEQINNYPGLSKVTGEGFAKALLDQLAEANIEVQKATVSGVYPLQNKFGVATQQGGYYEAKTVILASGVQSIKELDGELEFMGRGVSYCATCDGFLYKDKTIAVLCTSKRLEEEITLLSSFAKKVYLMAMYKPVSVQADNMEMLKALPKKLVGEKRLQSLQFAKPLADGQTELAVDGMFILREGYSPAVLLDNLQMQDGHVAVDRHMRTNIAGLFAAGDCTGKPYQYAKAVGEGNVAAHAVLEYLRENA